MRPSILFNLFKPVSSLVGIGKRNTALVGKVAGERVLDVCLKLPVGIVDRRFTPSIAEAHEGRVATFTVRVEEHRSPPGAGRRPYRVRCSDDTGILELIFFHPRADYLETVLPLGQLRVVSGVVERYRDTLQMPHPDIIERPEHWRPADAIEPVYPSTQGLSRKVYRRAVNQAVEQAPDLPEWQSRSIREHRGWPSWREALATAHTPSGPEDGLPANPARRRLGYDELLANQLAMALVRHHQRRGAARKLPMDGPAVAAVGASLPFALTGAQRRALAEIGGDLDSGRRMMRLLQGDVGSGKTVVAALAMAAAADAGGQAVLMAPTEILARQHQETLAALLAPTGRSVALLVGGDRNKARHALLEDLASGACTFAVGTHALFQESVSFADLRLAVIDEQHRFGVQQRMALTGKSRDTHCLAMTATPIPRTLLLAAHGDLDTSQLDEKPPGRERISMAIVGVDDADRVADRLSAAAGEGRKAFWVCPLVEESDRTDAAAAEARYAELKPVFGDRVALVHGRMPAAGKSRAMAAFTEGKVDLLVSTTVIEVGVDVPAADIMVIEQAERFGLAQLHQLRGRIGRGGRPGACVLLRGAPLSETARQRLRTVRDCDDGFVIAEEDLRQRGAGELLGTRQSGLPNFRLADLDAHGDLMAMARDEARLIVDRNPDLEGERGEALRTLLYLFERDEGVRLLRSG